MAEAYVRLTTKNNIGTVEFCNPSHNALPSDLLQLLVETIEEAGRDQDVKVVVLKSAGDRTFCAGASFDELMSITDMETGKAFFSGFANVINAMRKCPKLIIGRIQGKAVGGGVGLAAACDYTLATKYAAIKLSELSIGIGPFVIEPAVSRKMGQTAMSEMTINAEQFYDVTYAKANKLYANVFDSVDELDESVLELATKLSSYNPEALLQMKNVLWQDYNHWDKLLIERAKISGTLVLSNFTKKKLAGFVN
ncbi:enoyl-CoA hydratase/isomerase family protein [Aurantibacter sp.]|uniref:enoyl-CoA hydratase/isomerase family protein n=1 Tax=Aurantibacter sp. TaxID=2807103 RepID=UPI0035C8378F